jgi:hypothetical protein
MNSLAIFAPAGAMTQSRSGYKRLRIFAWAVALALGAVDAWVTRFTMNPDGVSYLDIGDAYWRGDWHNAINAYWSPLYSWILGLFIRVLRPTAYWEYPLVHLVNFLLYVAALASFEFFLAIFIAEREQHDPELVARQRMGLSRPSWYLLGYTLFLSCSLILIGLGPVTPDMCVAALIYLASALILKIRIGAATARTCTALGVVLGLAYLTKTAMFPLGSVFLATAMFAGGISRCSLRNTTLAMLCFLAVSVPFIAAISHAKRRLTFGDSGKINYAICVQGDDWYIPLTQTLSHPIRRLSDFPLSYEFSSPISGTYPLWYDLSYWHEGIKTHFNLHAQVAALLQGIERYQLIVLNTFVQLNFSLGLLILLALSPSFRFVRRMVGLWPVWIPALTAVVLYALVVVEFRYVAPFLLLLWCVAFSGIELPATSHLRGLVSATLAGLVITTLVLVFLWLHLSRVPDAAKYSGIVVAMQQQGLRAGDQLAVVGTDPAGRDGAFIARLGRMRIIAEVRQPDKFWAADTPSRERLIAAFKGAGAKAILSYQPPPAAKGWTKLGGTDFSVYRLSGER